MSQYNAEGGYEYKSTYEEFAEEMMEHAGADKIIRQGDTTYFYGCYVGRDNVLFGSFDHEAATATNWII